jgi:hypothetical protein
MATADRGLSSGVSLLIRKIFEKFQLPVICEVRSASKQRKLTARYIGEETSDFAFLMQRQCKNSTHDFKGNQKA